MLINEVFGIDGDEEGSLFDVVPLIPFLPRIKESLDDIQENIINETDHGRMPVRECITNSKRKQQLEELDEIKKLFPKILHTHEYYLRTLKLINFLR